MKAKYIFIFLLLCISSNNLIANEVATYEPVNRILNIPSVDAGDLGYYSAKMSLSTTTPLKFKILELHSIEPVVFPTTTYNTNILTLPFVEVDDTIYSASMLLTTSEPELIFSLESADPQQIARIHSGNEKIDETIFDDSGEILSIKEEDEEITSIFINSDGESTQIWLGENQLISKAVTGKTVLSFSNYTKDNVDVGMIDENGNTYVFLNIPLNKATSLFLSETEVIGKKRGKLKDNEVKRIHQGVSLGWELNSYVIGSLKDYIKAAGKDGIITPASWKKIGGQLTRNIFTNHISKLNNHLIKQLDISVDNQQIIGDIYNIAISGASCATGSSPTDCIGVIIDSSRPIVELSRIVLDIYNQNGINQKMAEELRNKKGVQFVPEVSYTYDSKIDESNGSISSYNVEFKAEASSFFPDEDIDQYRWYITDKNKKPIVNGSRGRILKLKLLAGTYQIKVIATDDLKFEGVFSDTLIIKDCNAGDTSEPISCVIENGSGFKTKSCDIDGKWSDFSHCEVSHCNTGYITSGNSCVSENSDDTSSPAIVSVSLKEKKIFSNTATISINATDNIGITGYSLSSELNSATYDNLEWIPVSTTINLQEEIPYQLSYDDLLNGYHWLSSVHVLVRDAAGNVTSKLLNINAQNLNYECSVPFSISGLEENNSDGVIDNISTINTSNCRNIPTGFSIKVWCFAGDGIFMRVNHPNEATENFNGINENFRVSFFDADGGLVNTLITSPFGNYDRGQSSEGCLKINSVKIRASL